MLLALTRRRLDFFALGGFGALVLLMLGDVLFASGSAVLGNQATDLYYQFISWRKFGFQELAQGNIALWNPHIFGGAPYFGGFQSALLYPLNVLFLVLPLPQAINWSIALHLFMMAATTYVWMRGRGLGVAAAYLAGGLTMFSAPYFLHIYAGHLTNLCAMVWAPVIFLVIDQIINGVSQKPALNIRSASWAMLGMFAVAMQIFAGHPQYVFFTALAAGIYALISLVHINHRVAALGLLISVCIGGLLLSSIQWMTGIEANSETIRSKALPFEFASAYAFSPESFLTMLAPGFFGNMSEQAPYWGRYEFWEMSAFIGVVGLLLAVYGAIHTPKHLRLTLIGSAGLLFILSLGSHTPLHSLLYEYVPGFNKFRGMSKFIFPATLFLVALAAHGYQRFAAVRTDEPIVYRGALIGALGLLLASLLVRFMDWQQVIEALLRTGQSYVSLGAVSAPEFLQQTKGAASTALIVAAVTLGLLAILVKLKVRSSRVPHLILALAIAEVFIFARGYRDTFDASTVTSGPVERFLAEQPGEYRVLNTLNPNSALAIAKYDLWGVDPGVVRRYAEFVAFTQGADPDRVTQFVKFKTLDRLYQMLRLKFVFIPRDESPVAVEIPDPMERLHLISKVRVMAGRDQILAAMRQSNFDPTREIILETPPQQLPDGDAPRGTVRMLAAATDWLEVEVETQKATILLVTDIYTPAWRARGLEGSTQSNYDLQPANYVLRGIPLVAGKHRIRIEYLPLTYEIGKRVSIAAWIGFVVAMLILAKLAIKRGLTTEHDGDIAFDHNSR